MRSKQRLVIFIALMLCTLMMSGCGIRSGKPAAADMVNPPEQTVIDQSSPVLQSPAPVSSPAIMQSPAQTPEVTPPIAAGQTTAGGQNQTGSQSSGSTPPQTVSTCPDSFSRADGKTCTDAGTDAEAGKRRSPDGHQEPHERDGLRGRQLLLCSKV